MESNARLYQSEDGDRTWPSLFTAPDDTWRFLLKDHDAQTFRRALARLETRQKAHTRPAVNIDDALDAQSPRFDPEVKAATLHYQAHTATSERLELIICTPAMREAAWRLGHQNQVLLDGTFGVSRQKVLLFILMAIDDDWKGVPIGLFLFSAPQQNNLTASGYDSTILTKLLGHYRSGLSAGETVVRSPKVWVTDSDLKERNAILAHWPSTRIILCVFHLRQAWRNFRSRHVSGGKGTIVKRRVDDIIGSLEAR